jgi:tetratricopeptide (TPR) repeat protein
LLRGIDLYTALASCNIALHRHEEALEQLKQAIAMYQGDETLTSKFEGSVKSLAKLYQKAAVCSEALKLYKDAVTQHNKAIELFV